MATIFDMEQDLKAIMNGIPILSKSSVGKAGERLVQELKAVAPEDTGHLISEIKSISTGSNTVKVSSNAYHNGFNYAIMHEKLYWDKYVSKTGKVEKNKPYNSSSPHYFTLTRDAFMKKNTLKNIVEHGINGFMKGLGFK